ncbi:cytochrome P450 family protein [Planococcus glaciei]|uniref:Cytochrome P450 n=1 Tax=Planococcus glaciei TaxID=459472 RepID=A0A1G8DQ22_9BACL|nr:cytochrome P450 [Planococcus glaciei]ETP68320.1 cytochrome P450 [Planococcus glaciei CHR43]MBX0316162.1 cytochrome P450 [Planococcus glaciei]QKX51367.1 cytochrome P450 [Planococcus glaciei]SDH59796.1 Cytochrome P450 [Planococcus glaciei]
MNTFNSGEAELFTEKFIQNPYPAYAKLREMDPVHQVRFPDGQKGWLITDYEDAAAVLKDQRFIKDYSKLFGGTMDQMSVFTQNMLFSDPPDHKRLRGLAQKAFTPKMISGMRDRIQEIADELLDGMENKKNINLIDDFAFPLPISVICEILGVPVEDRDKFRLWSNSLIEGTSGEIGVSVYEHMTQFIQYLGEWFAKVHEQPGDDLISNLIIAEEEGDRLTQKELYGVVSLLIIAGHETTVNLIGNTVLALLAHPEQQQKLREQPELIAQAIEESLRYNGPVEFSTSRWASEDMEFKGKRFQRGDLVVVSLNAANHDPEKFNDPEVFDITREKSPHLAFGMGIHFCLGAPLARLEGEIAISSLLERFPKMRLAVNESELVWRPGMIVRGVKEIPLAIEE